MTPLQLWLTGMTTKNDSDVIETLNFVSTHIIRTHCLFQTSFEIILFIVQFIFYGVDWDGPVLFSGTTREIVVPDVCCPLNEEQLSLLHQNVNILEERNDYGIGLYLTV